MPSKTLEDKVDDLTRVMASLEQQVQALKGQFDGINSEKGDLVREVASSGRLLAVIEQQLKDLRGWKDGFGSIDQLKIDLAVARNELDDLKMWQGEVKKQKDEWGRRLWALISSIIVALTGWALGYFSRPK